MNNIRPINISQATSKIRDYVDLQENLIKEFENQYHSFERESDFRKQPKTGVIHAMNKEWKFRKHGLGIDFEGSNPEIIINAHVGIIDYKRAFDSWRISEYFESLNYLEIEWDSKKIDVDNSKELNKLLEQLEKNNLLKKVSEKYKLYEFVESGNSLNKTTALETRESNFQTTQYDLSCFKPNVYPSKPDHIIPTGIEGLLTVYFAKDYDELVEQYGKMRLITNIVAQYKEDQDEGYVRDCLNEVESLVAHEHDEKYLRDLIVNQYGVKIPISKLGGSYQIFLERLHEELMGKRLYT